MKKWLNILFVGAFCLIFIQPDSSFFTRKSFYSQQLGVDIPLRIMPMGDSITEGLGDINYVFDETTDILIPTNGGELQACSWAANLYFPGIKGYRGYLKSLMIDEGLKMTYVGSVNVEEGFSHEGHAGWKIRDLDYCVQNSDWLEKAQPNMILLHIGTNDAVSGNSYEKMSQDLLVLLQHIYEKLPDTTEVIVAEIIPDKQPTINQIILQYDELIPNVVAEMAEEGKHVSFVDMRSVIHSDSDWDGTGHHPNSKSSQEMAHIWFEKILDVIGIGQASSDNKFQITLFN